MAALIAPALLLLVLACCMGVQSQTPLPYSEMGVRDRFETRFIKTCSKYDFVDRFVKLLEQPSDTYTIFVYSEQGANNNGGLGDRLGGVITALAYSLRTGRNFLLASDRGFERSFRRYHPSHLRTQVRFSFQITLEQSLLLALLTLYLIVLVAFLRPD